MVDTLKDVWADILGKDPSEIADDLNFFEAGGDSVSAIKLASKANGQGIQLNAQKVFQTPTFKAMSELVESRSGSDGTAGNPSNEEVSQNHGCTPSEYQNVSGVDYLKAFKTVSDCLLQCNVDGALLEDVLPCSPFQKELMMASHNLGSWNFQSVFEISQNAEERARQVIDLLHERNSTFRTRIAQHDTDLYQLVFKTTPKWESSDEDFNIYSKKALAPRMAYGDQLSRVAVVRNDDRTFIVWTQTHAIYDRWSKQHVLEDITTAFRDPEKFAASYDRPSFRKFVDACESSNKLESITYWKKQLQGYKNYRTLADIPATQSFKSSETEWLRKTTTMRRPKNTHITFATAAHAAWSLTLANESKLEDVFFCTFRSCRQMDISGVSDIIGPLWSLVPCRVSLKSFGTLQDFLEHIHQNMVEGIPHEPFGISAMDEHFGHKGYQQSVLLIQPPQPDFGIQVTVRDEKTGEEMSLRCAEEMWTQTRSHFGLYIALTPKGEDLELWTRFDEKFMGKNRVSKITNNFASMLEKVFEADWKNTTINSICTHLNMDETPEGAEDDGIDEDPSDTDYVLEGVDTDKPATLTYLLNEKSKNALACVVPGEKTLKFTYEDLAKHVQSFRKALAEIGIEHGSAISMILGNTYELVVAFLAGGYERAIAAPLNPAYERDEFEFYIDDLGSSLVLIPKGRFGDEEPAVLAARKYKAAIAEVYLSDDGQEVVLDVKDQGAMKDAINDNKGQILEATEDDIALVLHTSGTTGRPKAVPLTHKNLITNVTNICNTYRLRPKDRTMLIMPLFHVHGLLASFLSPLRSGGAAIIPERLTPEFWSQFKENGANWYSATPTMHRMILQFPTPESGMPKVRFIRSCSSQLAPSVFEQLEGKFNAPVLESYAMTEASHMMTSNPLPPSKRFPGCVGQAQNIDLKLLDSEGNAVGQGQEGEVCVRGENVTKGYLNNEEANTSSFTQDGFFRTGDQGRLSEEGYLTLTGRLKELINKGGEKISPVELDNVINQHDDVAECVSFGVEDEDYGQEVGCAIKLNDGKDKIDAKALRKWIGERLSAHKVPKKIWFPSEIPKTATGKLQRKMVAEKMTSEEHA